MYYLNTISTDGDITLVSQEKCPDWIQLGKIVGGYIESVPYWDAYDGKRAWVICNEEGKLHGLPFNALATGLWYSYLHPHTTDDVLVGPIVIVTADTDAEMEEL